MTDWNKLIIDTKMIQFTLEIAGFLTELPVGILAWPIMGFSSIYPSI
jgi:hypothetical protein